MSARVTLDGMGALIQAMTDAPDEIRAEGMDIIREETEATASGLRAAYPRRTGTLQSRVRTVYPSSTILLGIVRSQAPHASIWHFGTATRRTRRGANRGAMPQATPEPLVPLARRHRARMFDRLKGLLVRMGFTVTSP